MKLDLSDGVRAIARSMPLFKAGFGAAVIETTAHSNDRIARGMRSDYTLCVLRYCALASLATAIAAAQSSALPAHIKLPDMEVGAEFLGHSLPTARGMIAANGYLIIDVEVIPVAGHAVSVNSGHFYLRLNHSKSTLLAQSAGMVAASIKYPDSDTTRSLEVGGGLGDSTVALGRPNPPQRFPGDGRAPDSRPGRPTAPSDPNPNADNVPPPAPIEEVVAHAALPEGVWREHVRGCLFFPFDGKLKKLRSVELLIDSEPGKDPISLTLR
jgi:hypothetical protein